MFDSFAPLAWIITAIFAACFIFNLLSSGNAGEVRFNWVLGLAVLLWILYSCWETFLVDPQANIRVDLVVIFPVLLVVTIIGLIRWLKG